MSNIRSRDLYLIVTLIFLLCIESFAAATGRSTVSATRGERYGSPEVQQSNDGDVYVAIANPAGTFSFRYVWSTNFGQTWTVSTYDWLGYGVNSANASLIMVLTRGDTVYACREQGTTTGDYRNLNKLLNGAVLDVDIGGGYGPAPTAAYITVATGGTFKVAHNPAWGSVADSLICIYRVGTGGDSALALMQAGPANTSTAFTASTDTLVAGWGASRWAPCYNGIIGVNPSTEAVYFAGLQGATIHLDQIAASALNGTGVDGANAKSIWIGSRSPSDSVVTMLWQSSAYNTIWVSTGYVTDTGASWHYVRTKIQTVYANGTGLPRQNNDKYRAWPVGGWSIDGQNCMFFWRQWGDTATSTPADSFDIHFRLGYSSADSLNLSTDSVWYSTADANNDTLVLLDLGPYIFKVGDTLKPALIMRTMDDQAYDSLASLYGKVTVGSQVILPTYLPIFMK